MTKISEIGLCIGCNRRAILDDKVCIDCLNGPKRGRKWATMMHKCRTDPEYAQTIYNSIKTGQGKKFFEMLFGPNVISKHDGLATVTRIH